MATDLYLAMTGKEFVTSGHHVINPGWLDCCFSQSEPGLDHLPSALPSNSLLILTDRFPFRAHDPILISEQLHQTVTDLNCAGILLDFETAKQEELSALADRLVSALPCPVAVSDLYARELDCPVFLSPCPHHVHLKDHIATWTGREIWLDLARDAEIITVTPSGSVVSASPSAKIMSEGHYDEMLHCHYKTEVEDDLVRFLLWRTKEDMHALMAEAQSMGIQAFVGLYQEWQ